MPHTRESQYQEALNALTEASAQLRGITLSPQQLAEFTRKGWDLIDLAESRATR